MRKILFPILVLVIGSSIVFFLETFGKHLDESQLRSLKTLTLLIPDNLDASKTISYNSILLIDNLFPRLFRINENLQFEGEVARSWKVDQLKKTITVFIDTNFKFSEGSSVTAQDIATSINRIINPDSLPSFFFKNIKLVKVLSENSLEIEFLGWEVTALNQLGSPFLPIYKNGVAPIQNNASTWVTSSRYKIRNWSKDGIGLEVRGKLTKFLDVLPLEKVSKSLSSLDLMISRLNWISSETITSQINDKFSTYIFDSFNTSLVMSNISIPPVYRKCMANASMLDLGMENIIGESRIRSVLPSSMFSYDSKIKISKPAKPDLNRSMRLIVQRPNGLVLNVVNRLKIIANYCNIDLQVEDLENAAYVNRLINHDFDFAYVTISVLYNDPYFIFSFFHKDSKFNFTGSNSHLSRLIDRYSESRNQIEILEKSKALQAALFSEGLVIPLLTLKSMLLVKKPLTLKGHSLFDVVRWEDVL